MIQVLLKYQEVDSKLRKIENTIFNSDERKRAASAKSFLLESDDTAKKIDRRAEELLKVFQKASASYKKRTELVKEYSALAETSSSVDEVSYLAKKVTQLLDEIRILEKEFISVQKEIDEAVKSFSEFRVKYAAAYKEYGENRARYEKLKKDNATAIANIKKQLEEIAVKIDDKGVLERYNKRRSDKIFPVLVPLRDDMCGGCSMQLPLGEIEKLKKEKYIECGHCRRTIFVDV